MGPVVCQCASPGDPLVPFVSHPVTVALGLIFCELCRIAVGLLL